MGIALDEGDLTILKRALGHDAVDDRRRDPRDREGRLDPRRRGRRRSTSSAARRRTSSRPACRMPAPLRSPRGPWRAERRSRNTGAASAWRSSSSTICSTTPAARSRSASRSLNDLREGKLTMPLSDGASPGQRPPSGRRSPRSCASGTSRASSRRRSWRSSIATTASAETRALARDYAGAARVALGEFPDSEAKEGLLLATESVIDRIR